MINKRKRAKNATQDFVDILIILQKNGVDVTRIKNRDTLATLIARENEEKKENEKIKIEDIISEIEKKGIINYEKIGSKQNVQRLEANKDKYEKALEKAKFSKDIINVLIGKRKNNAMDIGQVSYIASTQGCDEKMQFLTKLEREIELEGKN